MSLFKSIGEILRGDGSNDGFHHETSLGAKFTVGPTKDPAWPDGKYVSVTDVDGNKQTIVYDQNNNIVKRT